MTTQTSPVWAALLLLGTCLLRPTPHAAQSTEDSGARFTGTWKGVCADRAEFIVLKLVQSGNEVAGTTSIANMQGGGGQCEEVIDPPTDEHAMKIHDAAFHEKTLSFKGSGSTAFEMSLINDHNAQLRFLGTPVENNPWRLKRVK